MSTEENFMKKITTLVSLLMASCFYGCSSPKQKPEIVNYVPVGISNTQIPADSQEKVRINPIVKSYAVGRRVYNGSMCESHTIYQEVQSSTWNLAPQPDTQPLLMAQELKQERYADSSLGRIEAVLCQIKNSNQDMENKLKKISELEAEIKKFKEENSQAIKRDQLMAENISMLKKYIDTIKSEAKKKEGEF